MKTIITLELNSCAREVELRKVKRIKVPDVRSIEGFDVTSRELDKRNTLHITCTNTTDIACYPDTFRDAFIKKLRKDGWRVVSDTKDDYEG